MKRAKKRQPRFLRQLFSAPRGMKRYMNKAYAAIAASNKRMSKRKPRYSLAELLDQMSPDGFPIDREWQDAPLVGKEIW